MKITLRTGRDVQIAPWTLTQVYWQTDMSEKIAGSQSLRDENLIQNVRLIGCQDAMRNAGEKLSADDLASTLSSIELDELYSHCAQITAEFFKLPAFARPRCNGRSYPVTDRTGERVLTINDEQTLKSLVRG